MKMLRILVFGAVWLLFFVLPPPAAFAQQAVEYFAQTCSACHTIGGGRLVGPDLKDVTQRKDRAWLTKFIRDPKAMIDSGDPYAAQLRKDAQGVVMPTLGLDANRATQLLDYIEAQSRGTTAAPTAPPERPFTPQDVNAGRAIFLGNQPLAGGGPPCVSCHTIKGVGGLSGGRLGPDLTLVFERLGGRRGLTAWLGNPASPTMMPVFRGRPIQPKEVDSLVALFQDTARIGGRDDASARLNFLLLGLGGAVIGLVTLDSIWKKRLRGVRRSLVHRGRGEE